MLLHVINPQADSVSKLGCCTCSKSTQAPHSSSWDLNLCAYSFCSAYAPTPALYLQVLGTLRSEADFAHEHHHTILWKAFW